MKKKEHLPVLGIGPFLVAGMAIIAAVAIVVFYYVCKLGTLSGFSAILLCAVGIILTITGIIIWFIGAVRSDMHEFMPESMWDYAEYCSLFVVSGSLSIIRKWLGSGMNESPRELAELILKIATGKIGFRI